MKIRSDRGFTLIELLVVIAIIAILAAILFPIISSAKDSANQSKCLTHLKQLGQAVIHYTDDWNGKLPPYGSNAVPNYDPVKKEPTMGPMVEIMRPYVKSGKIWRCPSDVGYVSSVMTVKPSFYVKYSSSYPFNEVIYLGAHPRETAKNYSSCKSHQKLVFFWDWVSHPQAKLWTQNTVFGDGHTEGLSNVELYDAVQKGTLTLWEKL